MKTSVLLFAVAASISLVQSIGVADIGICFGSYNTGFTYALVDDKTNDRSTCLAYADLVSEILVNLFDKT